MRAIDEYVGCVLKGRNEEIDETLKKLPLWLVACG